MNLLEFSLPTPKRNSTDASLKPFPVDEIPEADAEKQFTGIFNGLSVEVFDSEAIQQIYSNGCYGLSTKTKNVPLAVNQFHHTKSINQSQYEQKLAWNGMFGNQNDIPEMVSLVSGETSNRKSRKNRRKAASNVEADADFTAAGDQPMESIKKYNENQSIPMDSDLMEGTSRQTDPQMNLVVDPFPIEETLSLLLEEAFFLHFSLRCLKVMNFDQTHEYTTEELFDKFCNADPHFIQRFVVYQYYRAKNWVVKSGLKFGGDFLLYYKGPNYYHASYVVLVSDNEDRLNLLDTQSNYRVSESTNKEIILATVTRPHTVKYSDRTDCLKRFTEFKITEILPKRFVLNQLNLPQSMP